MVSIGIVGLPNVGKSTLFNALLKKQQAYVANYPFATIEPNIGVVPVPDYRLERLAQIVQESDSRRLKPPIKPAVVNFVDIAGLVKGASEGAGLGNKFLSHIREVSVIAHVVRVFEDENILKEGMVDPKSDYETIRTELQIADLQTLQNLSEKTLKADAFKKQTVEKLKQILDSGKNAYEISLSNEEKEAIKELNLLTLKPEILVLNVSEEDYKLEKLNPIVSRYTSILVQPHEKIVVISAKIEAELAALSENEQTEYLKELGIEESGLERLIKKAYEELGLISFLTAPSSAKASEGQGEKWEVRAWTVRLGSTSLTASGEIHTDFMKKFIKAEVVSFPDFVQYNGWKGAREHGKARFEGKDYIMQDGDVVEFKIGA
ncbi:redox-regulated ATPase YchF [Patescibacteria group bacterium]|nr:redox-regulated ATPase YchF [Patescibacteria group bacterium]